jgi:peptidoglycan/xylan/chitin deacetylase (PgdA/CDA1 family)
MAGKLAITFDDCCSTVATAAAPLMARYGAPATWFVCGQWIQEAEGGCVCERRCARPVSVKELLDLQAAGWEIASHTFGHMRLTDLTTEQIEFQIQHNVVFLSRNGINDISGFSYPWGVYDDRIIGIVRQYHAYARATVARLPVEYQRYAVRAYALSCKMDTEDALGLLRNAAATDTTVVFFGHRISHEQDAHTWAPERLESILSEAANIGVPILTMREIYGNGF